MNNLWSDYADPFEVFHFWCLSHGWENYDDPDSDIDAAINAYSRYDWSSEPSLPLEVGE